MVQIYGDTAIFTHTVDTVTSVGEDHTTIHERETIVFVLDGDRVVAVHEHISTAPDA
jgi:hypothetical protein